MSRGTLAQLVARRSHNPKVVSSILTGPILFTRIFIFSNLKRIRLRIPYVGALAQLVARRSHNPKVVSSILTGPTLFYSIMIVG